MDIDVSVMGMDVTIPVYGIDYRINVDYNSHKDGNIITILSGEFNGVELLMKGVSIEENADKTGVCFKMDYNILSGNDNHSPDELMKNQELCNFVGGILNNCLTQELGL